MNPFSDFRDRQLVAGFSEQLHQLSKKNITLMEVCGGHTLSIHRYGLTQFLPPTIRLISGPGCPVCVSDKRFIDQAVAFSRLPDVTIVTFGDLIRVPGSTSSLMLEQSRGADIRIVYSAHQALELAVSAPERRIIFLGIGFETTAPTTAAAILEAKARNITNVYFFNAHKTMPEAMAALIDDGVHIDGYIAPGHVSTITGIHIYEPIVNTYNIPIAISGFEPVDLMAAIHSLVSQIESGSSQVAIQYSRVVKPDGNLKAQAIMRQVFEPADEWWRGLGLIPKSGLKMRADFAPWDAHLQIPVTVEPTREDKGCICAQILRGEKTPNDCRLFNTVCTPANPTGACMVSAEGTCATYFKYRQKEALCR